jgi:plastocyanin
VSAITPLRAWAGIIAMAMLIAAPASAVAPKKTTITISGMAYSPSPVTVRAGETVEWVNKDVVDHTATEKNAAKTEALWDVSIAPGKSATVVMKTRGSFDYFCRYHPNMVARLTVK